MNARILVVDDEPDILQPIRYALERGGYTVETALDGETALRRGREEKFDVIVLDIMLPGRNGLDVCRDLRTMSDVPIIMLSARDDELDRVLGLELGADDYVTKPFSTAEVLSRVRAILRRRAIDRRSGGGATRQAGGVTVDLAQRRVTIDGGEVELTPSEFRLLLLLIDHVGNVLSREQIMEHLWDSPYVGDARACDVHISNLRRKIERRPDQPERILTIRGIGYKLVEA